MSAEDDIAALLSRATLRASNLNTKAASLIDASAQALVVNRVLTQPSRTVNPAEEKQWDVLSYDSPESRSDALISFPARPVVELPELPPLQALDTPTERATPAVPSLQIPAFDYGDVAAPPSFNKEAPELEEEWELPPIPDLAIGFEPVFQPVMPLEVPTLDTPTVPVADVSTDIAFDPATFTTAFAAFKHRIFGDLDPVLEDLKTWSRHTLDALIPALCAAVQGHLADKFAPALAYQEQLRERLEQRLLDQAQRVRDLLTDTSGWERPAAAQKALEVNVNKAVDAVLAYSRSQADTDTAEMALEMFQTCADIFEQLTRAVQAFKTQQLEQALEAHRLAIEYARRTIAALLAAFEAGTLTVPALELRRTMARVQVFELHLEAAVARYTVAKAAMELETAQQAMDDAQVQRLTSDVEKAQADVALYSAVVAAARSELASAQQPAETFEARVRSVGAQLDAYIADIQSIDMDAAGHEARIKGLTAKIKAFSEQAARFEEQVKTRAVVQQGQKDYNNSLLEEFTARVEFRLNQVKKTFLDNNYNLSKYQAVTDKLISDIEVELATAEATLQFTMKDQDGALDAYHVQRNLLLETAADELDRMKALAQAHSDGSQVLSSMASGAMSAANGIAGVILSES